MVVTSVSAWGNLSICEMVLFAHGPQRVKAPPWHAKAVISAHPCYSDSSGLLSSSPPLRHVLIFLLCSHAGKQRLGAVLISSRVCSACSQHSLLPKGLSAAPERGLLQLGYGSAAAAHVAMETADGIPRAPHPPVLLVVCTGLHTGCASGGCVESKSTSREVCPR